MKAVNEYSPLLCCFDSGCTSLLFLLTLHDEHRTATYQLKHISCLKKRTEMIELLKCKCADQKNRILRRGGLAATTVKFSTNGLPKLRSGLLLERKKDRLIAAYSLHCGRFSVTGLRLQGDHHWLGENGSLFRKPLMKIKDIHLPGKMLHLLVSCFTLGVKKQNHLVS